MSILGIAIARLRVWLTCISACLVLAVVTRPAEAQTQEQIDWCMNKGNSFSVDLRIGGCTASIRSGRWSGKGLARGLQQSMLGIQRPEGLRPGPRRLRPGDPARSPAGSCLQQPRQFVQWQEDHDRALADYDQAIRVDPNFALAFSNRGSAYENKKDYDRAFADFDQAIRLNPNFALAFNGRGNAYNNKRDYDRAIANYDQAIRLNLKLPRWPHLAAAGRTTTSVSTIARFPILPKRSTRTPSRPMPSTTAAIYDGQRTTTAPSPTTTRLSASIPISPWPSAATRCNRRAPGSAHGQLPHAPKGLIGSTASEADMAAATAMQANIAEVYAAYGIK